MALALAVAVTAPPAAAGQEAPLVGIVVEDSTGEPVAGARVRLVEPEVETRSAEDGSFRFPTAPLGRYFVRVEANGYPAVVEEVEITPEGQLFLPVFLTSEAAVLEELLVIVRQDEPRRSGSAMTAADLLSRQVPEVSTFTSVNGRRFPTGIDLRGRGSLGSSEPVVVLDGVRFSGGVGQAMDRLRQIAAGDVKSIRVMKGASSGFIYGAPHGVIYVQTHHGPDAP